MSAHATLNLRAPFPWYGGKRRAAHLIWPRFGDVPNYVEPFAGSLAVLLARPHAPRTETVNDKDCYLSNFWRALKADPATIAELCDWPVNEADLHARHRWLLAQEDFRRRMQTDPEYCDARIAAWWAWGICQWIGGQWCDVALYERGKHGQPWRTRPNLEPSGVHTAGKRPEIRAGGRGLTSKRPLLSKGTGVRSQRTLLEWMQALSERLRLVRVCCGDFERVLGPAPTFTIGLTGILLDPPYGGETGRDDSIYAIEDLSVAHRTREWALEHGDDPRLRIALCGYEGEHTMPENWEEVAWRAHGGTSKNENHTRERIWFSPHCLKSHGPLFKQEAAQ